MLCESQQDARVIQHTWEPQAPMPMETQPLHLSLICCMGFAFLLGADTYWWGGPAASLTWEHRLQGQQSFRHTAERLSLSPPEGAQQKYLESPPILLHVKHIDATIIGPEM